MAHSGLSWSRRQPLTQRRDLREQGIDDGYQLDHQRVVDIEMALYSARLRFLWQ